MKKSVPILTFILLLPLFTVATSTVKAQDNPTCGKDITVWTPTNRTYALGEAIKLEATSSNIDYHLHAASYNLDGTFYKLYNQENQSHSRDPTFGKLFGCVTLPKLAEGPHKITVHLQIVFPPGDFIDEVIVYFSVGDKNPPNITLNAIDGAVFNQEHFPLNFTINEPSSWTAYSLDNGVKTGIVGNTTLTVPLGDHSIVVYANDTAGNMGQSEIAHFTVQSDRLRPQIGDFVVLIAIVVSIVIVVAVLLIYERNRRNEPK